MSKIRDCKSSETLLKLANDKSLKDDLTYKKIIAALQRRAFGLGILLFALPSALPFSAIPGFSIIFSVPIFFFALQMVFGKKSLWLPKFIGNRSIPHDKLAKVIKATAPYLCKVERLLKPRWLFMTDTIVESITGILLCFLSIMLMLPIPFSNFIFAVIIIIFGLGISERDGLVITIAWIAAIISLIFIPTFIWNIYKFFS